MKKLILLTTLFLALACSKEDEPGESFLDKYNGTSWTEEDSGEILTLSNGTYFRNTYFGEPSFLRGCIQYKEGTNLMYGAEVIINFIKNEPNEFFYEIIFNGEELATTKIIPQGENLLMTSTSEGATETTILISSDKSYYDYCN